jgi:hypothetical protein
MSAEKLVEQHFRNAISVIDAELGEGYAKEHPELLGSYLQAEISIISTLLLVKHTRTVSEPTRTNHEARTERGKPRTVKRARP